jgi:PAS domain S-box-containing protein
VSAEPSASVPISPHTVPRGREVFEDGLEVVRVCDIVLGSITMMVAVAITIAAFTGRASGSTVALLWSIPITNVWWSAYTKHRNRPRAEVLRAVFSLPIIVLLYMSHRGYGERLWLPAEVMIVGQSVIWGYLTRRSHVGQLFSLLYAAAIFVAGVLSFGAPVWRSATDAAGILMTGFVVSLVASQLGRSLEEARRRRDEAEGHKHRLESTLTELTSARERLDAVLECAPAAILVVDRTGRIAFTNKAAPLLKKELVVGSNLLDQVGASGRALLAARMNEVLATGRPQAFELASRAADGGEIWYASHLGAMRSGVEVIGVVVISQEVTELKRAQAEFIAAQRLAAVGTLAAGIAHEINTPVQFVSDSTRFLREAVSDLFEIVESLQEVRRLADEASAPPRLRAALRAAADAQEAADLPYLIGNVPGAFERCVDGLDRIATIVRSMKEFAHPSQKEMASVDLNRAIQSTLVIACNEYKYVADVETSFGELPRVTCYANDVNQVVLNLIVNAAHAITDAVGGTARRGTIGVSTRVDGGDIVISIHDTGCGIPEGIRARIFEPFFTTKEVGKGTGQGLALAWRIVKEKHHGELTFDTKVGEGTTFHVRLPVAGWHETSTAQAA